MRLLVLLISMLSCAIYTTAQPIAQPNDYAIPFRSGSFTPEIPASAKQVEAIFQSKTVVGVQFRSLPNQNLWDEQAKQGIECLQYLGGNAYLLANPQKLNLWNGILNKNNVRTVFALGLKQRVAPRLYLADYPAHCIKQEGFIDLDLQIATKALLEGVDIVSTLTNAFDNLSVLNTKKIHAGFITIRVAQSDFVAMMEKYDWIIYANPIAPASKDLDFLNQGAIGGAYLSRSTGLALDGTGISIGQGDGGAADHADFRSRTTHWSGYSTGYHETHVAGILLGSGALDPRGQGMAPKSRLISEFYDGIIVNTSQYITDYNMTLTNNSWGNFSGLCADFGTYNPESVFADGQLQAGSNDNLLHIFSAGNSGLGTCAPLPTGYRTIPEGYQSAKNTLSVGNMLSAGSISPGSSCGPTLDGRIKPDLMAIGANVYSTWLTETYALNGGTSMSAPAVTGILALLQQRYKQTHGGTPIKGALLKALALNTADDYGNAGPDYFYGYGQINGRRAVNIMDANQYFGSSIAHAATNTHSITVPSGAKQLRVLLYWADKAASPMASNALVNNLNLSVSGVNPWILDPANPANPATQGIDNLNNTEQVTIDNPTAGTYTATVFGATVPMGSQPYYVVYEIVMPTVILSYPNGEDLFNTNEQQIVRWEANDANTNSFTLEYSLNSGATWTLIDNAIPATDRQYTWTTPSGIASGQCRMRISRNTTANTDFSDADFTIIGVPTITYTRPCRTYLNLAWEAIPGATSYEIMQINTTTGVVSSLATTTSTNYTAGGLSLNFFSYLTVRALGAGVTGRRAVAVGQITNTGACAGTAFDNDLSVSNISAPTNGRQNTPTAISASQNITYTILNRDDVSYTGTVTVSYQINGGSLVSSSVVVTALAPGAAVVKTITVPANSFTTAGTYNITVSIAVAGDTQPANNSFTTTIINAPNAPVSLPFTEGFESIGNIDQIGSKFALQNNTDFTTGSAARGRIRSNISSTNAHSGNRALTLDAFQYNAVTVVNDATMTVNLTGSTTADLRLDFWYKQHGEESHPGDFVWVRGNASAAWLPIYDLYANQTAFNTYKHVEGLNIKQTLAAAGQTPSSSFQIKFGQEGNGQVGSGIYGDGYTFDDVRISTVSNDLGIKSIDAPIGCTASAGSSVAITLENTTANAIASTTIPLSYTIVDPLGASTTVSESFTASFTAYGTQSYTFTTPYVFSQNGLYSITINTPFTDDLSANNTLLIKRGLNDGAISSYPYLQGFESDTGGWYHSGTNDDWILGTPSKVHLRRAANGTKAFVTKLTGNYSNSQDSYLYSPCFDLTSLTTPVLSFSFQYDIEYCPNPGACDYASVEYSIDGKTWTRLGAKSIAGSTAWYNETVQGFTNSDTTWHVASVLIPAAAKTASTRFRFNFHSDTYTGGEGIGIDDVHIFEKLAITSAATTTTTQTISGSTWQNVLIGGNLLAQINPQGNNLGSTLFKYYNYTGALRFDDGEYYMDRNFVIQPTTQPSSPVKLRLFFLKTEIDEVINGTGCVPCSKPSDPYILGVTKYSNNIPNEDDLISNNGVPAGILTYINRNNVDIIPYDNGYYAEFSVNSFSEFWLNHGGVNGNMPLPVQLTAFNATRFKENAQLDWATASEQNNDHFEVQVARSDEDAQQNNWTTLGSVSGHGTTNTPQYYHFTDTEKGKIGNRYYRLKQIDFDGNASYSNVKMLHFGSKQDWTIYPNPTENAFTIAWKGTSSETVTIRLSDAIGQMIAEQQIVSTGSQQTTNFDLGSHNTPDGIYNIVIITADGNIFTERIIKMNK